MREPAEQDSRNLTDEVDAGESSFSPGLSDDKSVCTILITMSDSMGENHKLLKN